MQIVLVGVDGIDQNGSVHGPDRRRESRRRRDGGCDRECDLRRDRRPRPAHADDARRRPRCPQGRGQDQVARQREVAGRKPATPPARNRLDRGDGRRPSRLLLDIPVARGRTHAREVTSQPNSDHACMAPVPRCAARLRDGQACDRTVLKLAVTTSPFASRNRDDDPYNDVGETEERSERQRGGSSAPEGIQASERLI